MVDHLSKSGFEGLTPEQQKQERADRWLVVLAEDAIEHGRFSNQDCTLALAIRHALSIGKISPAQRDALTEIVSKAGYNPVWTDVSVENYKTRLSFIDDLPSWNLSAPKLMRERMDLLSTISDAHAKAYAQRLVASYETSDRVIPTGEQRSVPRVNMASDVVVN